MAGSASASDEKTEDAEKQKPSRLQKFVTTYSTFLSSFVIGAAGLVATTIYQSKQQDIARRQAEAQIEISRLNTDNQWKIERAEILSKNLQVLTGAGESNLEQRYGVLLSLTRGNIIDPELAVSYALELGQHNPDYMRSVLLNVAGKSYLQIAHVYQVGCAQRYGVERQVPICKDAAAQAPRSQAIADLIAEELGGGNKAAMTLLADEEKARANVRRLVPLFQPYLAGLYDRRQFSDVEAFEQASPGARLVAALALAPDRNGELVPADEAAELAKFHDERRRFVEGYLLGRSCDPECKGRLADMLLTDGGAAGGYDHALAALLERPSVERAGAVGRLHARLLWCQIDPETAAHFRDAVLVPKATAGMKSPTGKPAEWLDDVLGLLALTPEPKDPNAKAGWGVMIDAAKKSAADHWDRGYAQRRGAADHQRRATTAKGANFCTAADAPDLAAPSDD